MPELTEQNEKDMKLAFKKFDRNGDGKISCDELMTVLRNLGQNVTNADAADMIKSMDSSGNGTIEYREFRDYMSKRGIKTPQEECDEIHAAFSLLDRDHNGYITAAELKYFVTNYGERMTNEEADAMIATMIDKADSNNDGKINYAEFAKVIAGTK